jgi:hypothetical protein
LQRTAPLGNATQRNFKRNPAHHPTPFKFPWRDQTQPWVTVRRTAAQRNAWLLSASQRRSLQCNAFSTQRITALRRDFSLRDATLLNSTQ